MKILIISNFVGFNWEGGNDRFVYLANMLSEQNDVELVTSSFIHFEKKQRNIDEIKLHKTNFKITSIYEPGYRKNICLKRFYSHYMLGRNLKKYLNSLNEKPDVIYCAVPSLDVAKVAAQYAKNNNIRFIVDVQDLWPEAFKMVFNVPVISDLIFYPMKKMADYIYSNADEIVAVSETYCNRALKVNNKVENGLSVFLGTDLKYFYECKEKNKITFNDNVIRIAYIGTLGHSYDIKSVIDAIKILNDKGINNIKFVIMGDGPLKQEFENYVKEKNVNCEFTGSLEYAKMVGLLCSCDIAINPIKKGSAGSIINKVGDYAMSGLPVVNTQECEEYRNLLEKYNAGLNAKNGNIKDLADKIELIIKDNNLRDNLGKGNSKLAEELFDREKNYLKIINKIIE